MSFEIPYQTLVLQGTTYIGCTNLIMQANSTDGAINLVLPRVDTYAQYRLQNLGRTIDGFGAFYIYDFAGTAATNNITVSTYDGATINGAASVAITTNNGCLRIELVGNNHWLATLGNAGSTTARYKVYTAMLQQVTTDNPRATVFENTLGFVPTWLRISAGIYRTSNAEWVTPINNNKVATFLNPTDYNLLGNYRLSATLAGQYIQLTTGYIDYATSAVILSDDLLNDGDLFTGTIVELRIYN